MNETVAFCGIVCNECPAYIATRKNDTKAKKEVARQWSTKKFPLKPRDIDCDGCVFIGRKLMKACSLCSIRKCALEKNIFCALCEEFPCSKLIKCWGKDTHRKNRLVSRFKPKIKEAFDKALTLASQSSIALLGTSNGTGDVHIRAMIKMENIGLKTIWFSTNTRSRKIRQLKKNKKACVYFVDFTQWMGLELTGTAEVLQDSKSRKRLWREGFEKYYALGIKDPDYSVLRFTAQHGRFYHGLWIVNLKI